MMTSKKVLLVDADKAVRESLAEQLELHKEFQIVEACNGKEALTAVENSYIDAVLINTPLPDMKGQEICRALRRKGVKCPLLVLTQHAPDAEIIFSPGTGADDYISKPFRLNVLLTRLRAQVCKYKHKENETFTIGPYSFKPTVKMLVGKDNNGNIYLTEKEVAILMHLYRAGHKAVSRDTLLEEVWKYNDGITTHTLETHIYRLRQKIERDPSKAEILVTAQGGYKLAP